jgi:hypothetical protein
MSHGLKRICAEKKKWDEPRLAELAFALIRVDLRSSAANCLATFRMEKL